MVQWHEMSSTFKGRETDLKPATALTGCGILAKSHHLSDPQFLHLSSDDLSMPLLNTGLISTAVVIIAITGVTDLQQWLGEGLPNTRAPRATVSINWDEV